MAYAGNEEYFTRDAYNTIISLTPSKLNNVFSREYHDTDKFIRSLETHLIYEMASRQNSTIAEWLASRDCLLQFKKSSSDFESKIKICIEQPRPNRHQQQQCDDNLKVCKMLEVSIRDNLKTCLLSCFYLKNTPSDYFVNNKIDRVDILPFRVEKISLFYAQTRRIVLIIVDTLSVVCDFCVAHKFPSNGVVTYFTCVCKSTNNNNSTTPTTSHVVSRTFRENLFLSSLSGIVVFMIEQDVKKPNVFSITTFDLRGNFLTKRDITLTELLSIHCLIPYGTVVVDNLSYNESEKRFWFNSTSGFLYLIDFYYYSDSNEIKFSISKKSLVSTIRSCDHEHVEFPMEID